MRVYVEHDMTVCHVSNVVTLKAGQIVEGPLATYLVDSGCNVTVEDAPAPPSAAEGQQGAGGAASTQESHTPGSGETENEDGESGPDAETGEAG